MINLYKFYPKHI